MKKKLIITKWKKRLTPEKIQKMKNKKMHDPKEKKKWTFVDIKKHPKMRLKTISQLLQKCLLWKYFDSSNLNVKLIFKFKPQKI